MRCDKMETNKTVFWTTVYSEESAKIQGGYSWDPVKWKDYYFDKNKNYGDTKTA